jgi:hypothetical protein
MHATIREKHEAPVMMSDPVEIHLTYLRTGLDEVKAALPVLRDKIDGLSSTLDAKIDKTNDRIDRVNSTLSEKIDHVNLTLGGRIDRLSEKMDHVNAALGGRLDGLSARVENMNSTLTNGLADVRGVQKAMFWVLGSAGALTALASLAQAARTFNWI